MAKTIGAGVTLISALAFFAATSGFAKTPISPAYQCAQDRIFVIGENTQSSFSIEVADDDAERALGLMHREHMPAGQGMLFVYEAPKPTHFWMANTLIALDMLFVDQRGVITHIHENAVPLDRTPIFGGEAVFAVLEINGGLSDQLGIKLGDSFVHPAFGPEAAMACENLPAEK